MSEARKDAWQRLVNAAHTASVAKFDQPSNAALSDAAKQWAACNGYVLAVGGDMTGRVTASTVIHGKTARPAGAPVVLPFGRSKGKALADAPTDDLEWMRDRLASASGDKPEWQRKKDAALLDAIKAELERR